MLQPLCLEPGTGVLHWPEGDSMEECDNTKDSIYSSQMTTGTFLWQW